MSRGQPERTCVGCRKTGPKSELVRVAGPARGDPAVDPTGHAPGRGAYVHATEGCAETAVRSGSLMRALRRPPSAPEAGRLLEELRAELHRRMRARSREGDEP